jgi:hypothetical protein
MILEANKPVIMHSRPVVNHKIDSYVQILS